jgi:hypothetical protein
MYAAHYFSLLFSSMKIVSFDVGIINLEYCVLELGVDALRIVEWRVVNIAAEAEIEAETEAPPLCQQRTCRKRAKYVDPEASRYCLVHAKSSPWHLPFALKSAMSAAQLASFMRDLGLVHARRRRLRDQARDYGQGATIPGGAVPSVDRVGDRDKDKDKENVRARPFFF